VSHADVIQFAVLREARLDALLTALRHAAQRHGWLFRGRTREPSFTPSITKCMGERLWFVWESDRRTKDIDKISLDLATLELEQVSTKFLELTLANSPFARSSWWSDDQDERVRARAFAASFLIFLEDVIRVASPTHGLGETDDLFTQEQLNTTILPPAEELVAAIQRNPRPPWIAYFGPGLAEKQAEQIRRLGAAETRSVSGGILVVFRTNPSFVQDMSPEELRRFREAVEPVLSAELRRRTEGESAPPP